MFCLLVQLRAGREQPCWESRGTGQAGVLCVLLFGPLIQRFASGRSHGNIVGEKLALGKLVHPDRNSSGLEAKTAHRHPGMSCPNHGTAQDGRRYQGMGKFSRLRLIWQKQGDRRPSVLLSPNLLVLQSVEKEMG